MNEQQKCLEGRKKLLALAETPSTSQYSENVGHSPFSRNLFDLPAKLCRKPRMGLKYINDVKKVQRPSSALYFAEGSVELSLQEKFSQALKSLKLTNKQGGGSIAADDVIYYSTGNQRINNSFNRNNNDQNDKCDSCSSVLNKSADIRTKASSDENIFTEAGIRRLESTDNICANPDSPKLCNNSDRAELMLQNLPISIFAENAANRKLKCDVRGDFLDKDLATDHDSSDLIHKCLVNCKIYPSPIICHKSTLLNQASLDESCEDCSRIRTTTSNNISAELRTSSGSPTDSGYRSVPREMLTNASESVSSGKGFASNNDANKLTSVKEVDAKKCFIIVDPSPKTDSSSHGVASPARIAKRSMQSKNRQITDLKLDDSFNTTNACPARCPSLIHLPREKLPWSEKDLVQALQKGRTKTYVDRIAVDVVPCLAHFLQRPLIRLGREMQLLSCKYGRCTKKEAVAAAKMILPLEIVELCVNLALQAVCVGNNSLKQSKSSKSNLNLSVGKFTRWMLDFKIARRTYDEAAIILCSIMEALLETTILHALDYWAARKVENQPNSASSMLTSDRLIESLHQNRIFWPLFQTCEHLAFCRPQRDELHLPHRNANSPLTKKNLVVEHPDSVELTTCVANVDELSELVSKTMSSLRTNEPNSPSTKKAVEPFWHPHSIRTLFHYMRCSRLTDGHSNLDIISLQNDKLYGAPPPLIGWIKIALANCEYRNDVAVNPGDVARAARILLSEVDYPDYFDDLGFGWSAARYLHLNPHKMTLLLRLEKAEQLIASGRRDDIDFAIRSLGAQDVNAQNEQGLTLLMTSALNGWFLAAERLLAAGADVDSIVAPAASDRLIGWSPLTFAIASKNQISMIRLLLNKGASVELPAMLETPLQLASTHGDREIVSLLLRHGADPFYCKNDVETPCSLLGGRNVPCAVVLAAGHGRRDALRLLLARRQRRHRNLMSLEEFLAETNRDAALDDPVDESPDFACPQMSPLWYERLLKNKQRIAQEALYQAAENGHLEIVMDLRNLGVPWNTHIWSQALAVAREKRRKALVQILLDDFIKYDLDEISVEFIENCLPMLFDILKKSKNDVSATKVAEILSRLYGDGASTERDVALRQPPTPRFAVRPIDSTFINNAELSDVKFLVAGRPFYAHGVVLASSGSQRLRRWLAESGGGDAFLRVDDDVDYDVFRMAMEYLYNGQSPEEGCDLWKLIKLLKLSEKLELNELKLTTEYALRKRVSTETCADVYKCVKVIENDNLATFCLGYFLTNMPTMLNECATFRNLLYPPSARDDGAKTFDFLPELLNFLTRSLLTRLTDRPV